jgi:ceramide glucosyltransferase
MPLFVVSIPQIAGLILGLAALAYLVLALRATWRFRERAVRPEGWQPAVSVLKPVHGDSPYLYDCLKSYCDQDWPKYEVIFGAHTANDPAVAVVQRLIKDLPDRDIRLVIDESLSGPNRKAANLANIAKTARYDIIVLSDSDVRVDRDCVASMAAPFRNEKTGAVATIYKGLPHGGFAARFAALYINDWFVPSVLVDVELRGIDFVFGAMSAVRREALDAIGGFEHLSKCLAEDFAMGRLVDRKGWKVVLSPYACDTICAEKDLAEVFRHETRWQRSERACRPVDHFMSVVTWPLPLLLVLLLPQPSIIGLSIIGLEITLRIALHYLVRRRFKMADAPQPWLVPARECFCFGAWFAGLFGNTIHWGKETFTIPAFRKLMAAADE